MALFGKSKEESVPTEVRQVLAMCAAGKVPALLLGHHTGRVVDGLFLTMSERDVTIALRAQPSEVGIEPMSLWCVTFSHKGRAHVFLASALSATPGSPPKVTLLLPAQIAAAEGRFSFRTPVVPGTPVAIRLTSQSGNQYRPDILDLSLGGVQVRFPPSADPGFPSGTRLTVDVALDRAHAVVVAEVRRRDGSKYGLQFTDVFKDGELAPPDGLKQIVRALELRWLREQ